MDSQAAVFLSNAPNHEQQYQTNLNEMTHTNSAILEQSEQPIPHQNSSNNIESNYYQRNIASQTNVQASRVKQKTPTPASSTSSGQEKVVGLHYRVGKKIGEGSFGVLFEGINLINGIPVAIKFEPRKAEAPQLREEYKTYRILAGCKGVPNAYYLGQQGLHNILVIDLLGPSLEDLFEWCGRRFSVKTTVQVAVQMISLMENLHAHSLIYRDIKPDNFLIGRPGSDESNMVHLIDFGMAKLYRDPKTKKHIPYRERKSLSGTARYMSINTHLGREQSRRDDMEALGHVFFYFLRGQLPWQGLKAANNKQKYEKIGEKKRQTNVYDLAQGVPIQFGRYLDIVRNLEFEEVPDYEGYRQLLISALKDQDLKMDGNYDWMDLNGGTGWDYSINKKPNLHGYGRPNPPNEKKKKQQQAEQQQAQVEAQQNAAAAAALVATNNQSQKPVPQLPDNKLDPNSYEAYEKQLEQKYMQQYMQQQQKQQQQPQQQMPSYQNMSQQQQIYNAHVGTRGGQMFESNARPQNGSKIQQQQPNNNSSSAANYYNNTANNNSQQQGYYMNNNIKNNQLQHDNHSEGNDASGFFSKLGCC
ncbi:hypothetical protein QEN19_000760 [Hanseniaspora menglaensis]